MSDLTGQTLLSRYRVEAFAGRGGMAEVYRVWDDQRAAYLAMKLLREDLAQDRVFLRRFRREAETLARLQHPHIVRFYGLEQDGLAAFMLMDYIEGTSLRTEIFQCEGVPLPTRRIREVMQPICSALHYAHNQGMIHCDVKPGNILIDQTGRVLVSDFGIARMTDASTATMVGAGTPAYMAPEQVLGQEPVPQTDIYALGVVLYEMLTGGERPFTGEEAKTTGSTSEKVRWEQLNLKPPSPRKYDPDISPELEAVVLGCLAKEPEQRYPAPLDLLNELERAMGEADAAGSSPIVESRPALRVKKTVIDEAQPEPARPRRALDAQSTRYKSIPMWLWTVAVVVIIVIVCGVAATTIGGMALGGISTSILKPIATNTPTLEPTATNTNAPTLEPTATNTPTFEPTSSPTLTPLPLPAQTLQSMLGSQTYDLRWCMSDLEGDVEIPYIDVVYVDVMTRGDTLIATLLIQSIPKLLTFNRDGVPANALEYSWNIWIDIDGDSKASSTGYEYFAEYQLAVTHFVFQPNTTQTSSIPSGTQQDVWKHKEQSWENFDRAEVEIDYSVGTITITGTIPGLNPNSRITFSTFDYNPGDHQQEDRPNSLGMVAPNIECTQ